MKRTILSEKTLLPISLVLVLIGGIWVFARVNFATEANAEDIGELQETMKSMQRDIIVSLQDNQSRLSEINSQVMMLDTKLQSVSERLNRMADRERKQK